MLIPGLISGYFISIVTFPGVIVHELGHQFFCIITKTKVQRVCYFRFGSPAGYVMHDIPSSVWRHILISVGPLIFNSVIGILIGLIWLPFNKARAVGNLPQEYLTVIVGWLGVSVAMHSFPSVGDAKSIWKAVWVKDSPTAARILGIPLAGIIYLGAIGSVVWLDLLYGIFIVVLLPKLFFGGALEGKQHTANTFNDHGLIYLERGDYARSIVDFTKVLKINPKFDKAYYNRGLAFQKEGDLEQALIDYARAIGVNPHFSQAYYNRGIIYTERNDLDHASADFKKAIENNPGFVDAYNNLGLILDQKRDYDQAITVYSKAIEIKPNYAKSYCNRATAYYHKGKTETAIADYTRAIELNPKYGKAYANRAVAYYVIKDFDHAMSDVAQAQALDFTIDTNFLQLLQNSSVAEK